MEREEALKFLLQQLEMLNEEHVDDLMRNLRSKELEDLCKDIDIDFSVISELFEYGALNLKVVEIPKNRIYELVFYIKLSGYPDGMIFEDWTDFKEMLLEIGENAALRIALSMSKGDIANYTIEELLAA